MGMFLQVRWCRGQVLTDKPHMPTHDLFFTIEHLNDQTWHIKDIDIEIDPLDPFSRLVGIQGALFDRHAVAVVECVDIGQKYACKVWMMTGQVRLFYCSKSDCVKAYKATTIEDSISAGDQSTITINKRPKTPSVWDQLFTDRLLSQ